jgi:hypothetical protein
VGALFFYEEDYHKVIDSKAMTVMAGKNLECLLVRLYRKERSSFDQAYLGF